MSTLQKPRFLSVEEYLEAERLADVRHEYIDGQTYNMAGASKRHNRIAGNLFFQLRAAARGGPCDVFMSDMKLHIPRRGVFYYPDVMLTCDPADVEEFYSEHPCLVAEILSPTTESVDRREKLLAYRDLPGLRYYLMIASDEHKVEYWARNESGEWETSELGEDESLVVRCGDYRAELRLADLYEDVDLG